MPFIWIFLIIVEKVARDEEISLQREKIVPTDTPSSMLHLIKTRSLNKNAVDEVSSIFFILNIQNGKNPLMIAIERNEWQVGLELLSLGVSATHIMCDGTSILQMLCKVGNPILQEQYEKVL